MVSFGHVWLDSWVSCRWTLCDPQDVETAVSTDGRLSGRQKDGDWVLGGGAGGAQGPDASADGG